MMKFLFLFFFGIFPPVLWLLYFLQEDVHPEPKRELVLIFFLGSLTPFVAAAGEYFFGFLFSVPFSKFEGEILSLVLVTPIIEEYVKYLVVREIVISNPVFDEPTDLPIYMITSAMGFAATENVFFLLSSIFPFRAGKLLLISGSRFLTAILLHALSSGMLGIFLSLSFYYLFRRKIYFLYGFLGAVLLHSFYNFLIMDIKNIFTIFLFLFLSLDVLLWLFKRIKRLPSACKIKI